MTRLRQHDLLLVDDRPDTLDDLILELQRLGARPITIRSYDEAQDYIAGLNSWAGLALIDIRLPSVEHGDTQWLGLRLGAQIGARFGPSAKFAYVTAVVSMVPANEYSRARATSVLGVIDKFHYVPRHVAARAAAEMALTDGATDEA